ncbi:MAG: hypothetical protein ACXAC8_15555 [Candidatus Hodarchaeales archaeon]|jgi:hypothetical protein
MVTLEIPLSKQRIEAPSRVIRAQTYITSITATTSGIFNSTRPLI